MELRPALRAPRDEADERLADLDVAADPLAAEDILERARLRLGIVGLEVQLGQAEPVALLEQLVDPVARRMELEPVAGIRRDERPAAAVLLDAELRRVRASERSLELVLVEREPEVVDARKGPLARLHDDVDRPELELGQPQLEADGVELRPGHPRLVRRKVLADAAVPRDQVEAELADVARLDFAHPARHEVVVEEMHGPAW